MSMHENSTLQNYFPEAAAEASADAEPATCPACKGHMRKTDLRHTRDANYKFLDDESVTWTCPGCVNRKNRAHPSHRNDGACQWVAARTMPEGAARARTSTHPRDGRAPARSDPSASLRLEGRSDGVPGASEAPPVVPEALTPEEAEARRRAKSQRFRCSWTKTL